MCLHDIDETKIVKAFARILVKLAQANKAHRWI